MKREPPLYRISYVFIDCFYRVESLYFWGTPAPAGTGTGADVAQVTRQTRLAYLGVNYH